MGDSRHWGWYLQDATYFALMFGAFFYLANQAVPMFLNHDPEKEQHEQARIKAAENLRRVRSQHHGHSAEDEEDDSQTPRQLRTRDLVLDQYENQIAMEVVAPEDIATGFDDIGGLEDIIDELKESVIYPLTMPELYARSSVLLSAPSGVLLYGPPGCGKTMLAKALAHESGANFINLRISTLTEKWYGDSNKLVRAVFSLARKLQPAIVFIDEIDAVLGQRRSGEHEASGMVKAEFMTLWDGLASTDSQGRPDGIMILGATNRMQDIDEAILRRMPKKFPVPLPALQQRERILKLVLKDTRTDPDHFDITYLARVMAGMSGSDIKEACRDASMLPFREYVKKHGHDKLRTARLDGDALRGVRTDDFFGRKGGTFERARQTPTAATTSGAHHANSSSGDEYEDIEDVEPQVEVAKSS